ncbi:MAG TPA: hypothetical protein VMS56_12910 [Thermoanaerobaculia bacterium]|nr:hypothetical protein [Thermoanaerobaculia bacterium]
MTQPQAGITIVGFGPIHAPDLAPLGERFHPVEHVDLKVPADSIIGAQQSKLRAAAGASSHDWILLLRSGERLGAALADEIRAATGGSASAWGFRLRIQPTYDGRPLRIGDAGEGEIRLFHRRHARFDLREREAEMRIEGAVVRLREALERPTFDSAGEHRAWLARVGVPHSTLRRLLLFAHAAITTGALWRSRATLRYLWNEAGWDVENARAAGAGDRLR